MCLLLSPTSALASSSSARLPCGASRFGELLYHLVEAKARGLLPRRERLEARQPVGDIGLRRHEQKDALDPPRRVADRFVVRTLERVGAQIVERRHPQVHERLLPDAKAVAALLGEDELPAVVTERHELAVVVPVEELLARRLLRHALQVR